MYVCKREYQITVKLFWSRLANNVPDTAETLNEWNERRRGGKTGNKTVFPGSRNKQPFLVAKSVWLSPQHTQIIKVDTCCSLHPPYWYDCYLNTSKICCQLMALGIKRWNECVVDPQFLPANSTCLPFLIGESPLFCCVSIKV